MVERGRVLRPARMLAPRPHGSPTLNEGLMVLWQDVVRLHFSTAIPPHALLACDAADVYGMARPVSCEYMHGDGPCQWRQLSQACCRLHQQGWKSQKSLRFMLSRAMSHVIVKVQSLPEAAADTVSAVCPGCPTLLCSPTQASSPVQVSGRLPGFVDIWADTCN